MLDFFAGSGVATRVCMEEGRHSIAGDVSRDLSRYLKQHIAQIKQDLFGEAIPFRVLHEDEFELHPVFFQGQVVK